MQPKLIRLDTVEPQQIQWLWKHRIPQGKPTVIVGDPDVGKSTLTADIVARVTTGGPWPDDPTTGQPGGVVILSAEDDIADTIVPRMTAAGADLSRVKILEATLESDGPRRHERHFCLKTDVKALERAIQRTDHCRLVVIDPLSAYLAKVNTYNNPEVRGLLAPLAKLAEKHGVSILIVEHLNKRQGAKAMHRLYGTIALAAAARAVWMVCRDPHDAERRLLLKVKNNLTPDIPGLAYTIATHQETGVGVVKWCDDRLHVTADEALAGNTEDRTTLVEQAMEWLKEVLADKPIAANEIKEQGEDQGFSWATLRRAKDQLEITSPRKGFGKGGTVYWSLPIEGQNENVSTYGEVEHLWRRRPSREQWQSMIARWVEADRNDPPFDPERDLMPTDFI